MTRTALIVDDHLVNRVVLEKFFARLEFATESAADIPTAIRKYQKGEFSLVALDLHMPKLSGLDFLEFVQSHCGQSGSAIPPIFVITGDVTVRAPDLASRCPIARLFFKPVDLQQLKTALCELELA